MRSFGGGLCGSPPGSGYDRGVALVNHVFEMEAPFAPTTVIVLLRGCRPRQRNAPWGWTVARRGKAVGVMARENVGISPAVISVDMQP